MTFPRKVCVGGGICLNSIPIHYFFKKRNKTKQKLIKLRTEGNFFNPIRGMCEKSNANIILNDKILSFFSLR